jgi:ADP-heptose:LPS heptosyltransferase
VTAFLVGGNGDRPRFEHIRDIADGAPGLEVVNLAGELSVHEAIAVIRASDACVGNDTFGLHAAVAVGTPSVVILWGGNGRRWAPWGDPSRHVAATAGGNCANCLGICRHASPLCMRRIPFERVLVDLRRVVDAGRATEGETREWDMRSAD